jgi:hypothetical protein
MYVDLLERAVDDWVEDASDDELLDHVLACRLEMLIAEPRYAQNAYGALAAELAYDRSLIMLSTAHGIEAAPALFVRPGEERRRLEHALGDAGVDLTDLARRRRV